MSIKNLKVEQHHLLGNGSDNPNKPCLPAPQYSIPCLFFSTVTGGAGGAAIGHGIYHAGFESASNNVYITIMVISVFSCALLALLATLLSLSISANLQEKGRGDCNIVCGSERINIKCC